MKLTEEHVQQAFASILRDVGFEVREEVRYGGKRFDVVARLNGSFFGFEVKLHDWRRALRQLRAYQLCCDRAFLVKYGQASEDLIRECSAAGVGLYVIESIGADPRQVTPSKRSTSWSRHFSASLMRAFL